MAEKALQRLIEGGKLKRFFDRRLAKAIAHPFREHLLAVFNERIASASEIGRELDLEVPDFYKHITVLEKLGCIEEVDVVRLSPSRRRGGKERFFQAKATVAFDGQRWGQSPASVRSDVTTAELQLIWDEVIRALSADTFTTESDRHLSWIPAVFDRLGWEEAREAMEQTLRQVVQIQRRSAERVVASNAPKIPATIAMMGFRTPARRPS